MISLQISGQSDIEGVLRGTSAATKKRIGMEAIIRALTPILDEASSRATDSVETGNLKESLGFRVIPYKKGGKIFAVIGPRKGFKKPDPSGKGFRVASKYAHLVEFGHIGAGGKFVAAKPFMRPAFAAKNRLALSIMGVYLGQRIEIEAKRQARRRARTAKS